MKTFLFCLSALLLASCLRLSKSDEGKPGYRSTSPTGMGSGLSTLVHPTPVWTPSPLPTSTPYWTRSPTPTSTPYPRREEIRAENLDRDQDQDYYRDLQRYQGRRQLPDTRLTLPVAQQPETPSLASSDSRRHHLHLELQGFAFSSDLTVLEQNGIMDFSGGLGRGLVLGTYYGDGYGNQLGLLFAWSSLQPIVNAVTLSSGPLQFNPVMLRLAMEGPVFQNPVWRMNAALGLGANFAEHRLDPAIQDQCRAAGFDCTESLGSGFGMNLGFGFSRRLFAGLSAGLQLDYYSFIHQAYFGARSLSTGIYQEQNIQVNLGWLTLSPRIFIDF